MLCLPGIPRIESTKSNEAAPAVSAGQKFYMFPYLEIPVFGFWGVEFHSFEILVALGFFVGAKLAAKRAREKKLKEQWIYDGAMICLIVGIFGAHLFHILWYRPELLTQDPKQLLYFWSGLSSYGGFFCAALGLYVFFWRKNVDFLPYADCFLYGLVPGWVSGRLGCYTAHDHPGKLSDFFMTVQYPGGNRHDLGLYEALFSMLLVVFMYTVGKKMAAKKAEGWMLGLVLSLYGVVRFFLDFLRAEDLASSDKRYFGLTPAQYFSMIVLGIGLFLLVRARETQSTQKQRY